MIVRHVLEQKRNSNTGRLVAKVLGGSQLVEYANPNHPWDPAELACDIGKGHCQLLYPSTAANEPIVLPSRLIVVDASWSQARHMTQRIEPLRTMKRLCLPPPQCGAQCGTSPLPRMRKGQTAQQMSTAESVIAALRLFELNEVASHLEELLRELVRRFALPQRHGVQGSSLPFGQEPR